MKSQRVDSQSDEYLDIFNSLVQSQNQWSSMPDIVSLSFKAIGKYLASHNQRSIQARQQFNHLKVTVNELQLNKASKRDLERQIQDTRLLLEKKQSYQPSQMDQKSASIDYKFRREEGLDRTMIEQVKTIALALIQERISQQSQSSQRRVQLHFSQVAQDLKKELDQTILRIKEMTNTKENQPRSKPIDEYQKTSQSSTALQTELQIKRLTDELRILKAETTIMNKTLYQKLDRDLYEQELKILKARPPKQQGFRKSNGDVEVETLRKIVEQMLVKKAEQKELTDFKNKVWKAMTEKIKLQEVQEIIKSFQSELASKKFVMLDQIAETRSDMKKIEKHLLKAFKLEVQAITMNLHKPRKESSPSSKKTNSSISEIKSSLHRVEKKIHERLAEAREITQSSYYCDVKEELSKQWSKIQDELSQRDKKLCQTIEQTLETNRLTLESKSTRPKGREKDAELALNILCKQMVLGKWTCSSSELIGDLIPWETQLTNTNRQNFVWQEGNTNILVVAPGIYRIEFGFFTVHKSDVLLLVNMQPVLRIKEDQGKHINRKHPNGCIGGNTLTELIVMPARGRISLQVVNGTVGEIYLGLAKI